MMATKNLAALFVCLMALSVPTMVQAWTVGAVPADGVYKFTFGVDSAADGFAVPASAVYDAKGTVYYDGAANATFSYGFLGTTETSYVDDVVAVEGSGIPTAIDGFSVVQGQQIVLHDTNDLNSVSCVCGPAASEYLPAGASPYEGRYPVRFSMRGEDRAYYAVTCTVANVSSTTNADVTLFSERCHIIAHHLSLAPGETKTFAWSVELAPNVYKTRGTDHDNAINVCVVGEKAALANLTVVKQPQTSGTVRGESVANMNVGKTMWLCTDSTGTDQANAIPYFSLQNYSGVGSGLSRYAPANLSIRNQGEGGLATNANAHRNSCLLKPGDYLYVEYGHNESGVTSYTNNLETYLADVNTAGAYLVIVSPVERRTSWDSGTSTWGRSLQGIAEAGEAWVEDKIAQGARNVAFIDLNKRYNDWMNTELQRIHTVNSDVSLNAAISYYYRSAKGANVDNTHINNAGTDQAAYWVWYDALARVAAGENAAEGSAAKVQADVLKGITEGYQGKIGVDGVADNLPWQVTDEIINAGAAPNAFWDTPVSSGFDYANDAVVANVAASTNADGTVTISGVTMRILNPNNYYKAVIDIISADSATTNRYYSYYNYDIGGAGKVSGDLVDPNEPGFLDADKGKDEVVAADLETLTIPSCGKAEVWIAEADAGTWQVGANEPCSPKYPVEWWSEVLLDDDCSDALTWTLLTQAITTTNVVDGAIYFSTTGANADNTKKNFGYYPARFSSGMGAGRYRITFKAKMDSGKINFQLGDSINSSTTLFHNSKTLVTIDGTTVTGYNSTTPMVTVDENGDEQNVVNKLRWIDVDIILDRDNDRAFVSVGGSDYVEYKNAAFLPGSYSDRTWNYFGITCPGQQSSYGYIDDVKVVKLASVTYPTVTASAAPGDSAMGSVTINGYATNSITVYSGNDFIVKAASADADFYVFECWKDGEDNVISTSPNLFIANATESIDYTAHFREYGADENRVITWDFSAYQGDFAVVPTAHTVITDNGMEFHFENGDSMTGDGIYWHNSATGSGTKSEAVSESGDHYIVYTPVASGTLELKFSIDNWVSKRTPMMVLKAANSASECVDNSGDVAVSAPLTDTEYTLSANLTAGTTYYIWTYSYNWGGGGYTHNYTIPSITYTYAPVRYTATAAVGNPGLGGATVNEGATAEVLAGKRATFTAWPVTAAYKFVNWTDGESNVVSTEATFATNITEDVTYTASFAVREAGETYNAEVDFVHAFGGGEAVTPTSSTSVTRDSFTYFLASGDTLSENGLYWGNVGSKTSGTPVGSTGRHIEWTASANGSATITFQVGSIDTGKNVYPYLMVATNEQAMVTSGAYAQKKADAVDTDLTLTFNVEAGTLYKIYAYYYNRNSTVTISSIVCTHASDLTTLSLANDSEAGAVSVNGVAGVTGCNVQKGEYVKLSVAPNAGSIFGGWKDANDEIVSEAAEFWVLAEDAISLTTTWRTANVHNFVWNPAVASGSWNDSANWLYEGLAPAETYPSDVSQDVAIFNSEATVTLAANATASNVWFNAAVTLTGGYGIVTTMVAGEGAVTLNNSGFDSLSGKNIAVSNDLWIVGVATNWVNQNNASAHIYGDLKGSGTINLHNSNHTYGGAKLYGNNTEFAGEVIYDGGSNNRRYQRWDNGNATSSNAFWRVKSGVPTGGVSNDDGNMMNSNGTYYFGGYSGNWWHRRYSNNYTMEIGAINRDSDISIYTYTHAPNITKVGTANLMLGTKTINNLTISGGSVTMPIGIAPNTLAIAAGTKIKIPGDPSWTPGTVTNLFSYTTLEGAAADTLPSYVEVLGLSKGRRAKVSVSDKTVVASIYGAPMIICVR